MHTLARSLLFAVGLVPLQSDGQDEAPQPIQLEQEAKGRIQGQSMAVAYSGFREGQHPDRGNGANNPGRDEVLEDLRLLVEAKFRLIRMYDSGINSRMALELIREHKLPITVLLGAWLDAEVSNHKGCAWLTVPIPDERLTANKKRNRAEVERAIGLAKEFPREVIGVNVGNEALVGWSDHMVPLDTVRAYVREVREAIDQPVTVAETFRWWVEHGKVLAAELDFVGVHVYPVWEGKDIEAGLSYTIENMRQVRAALPKSRLAILEAGWATTGSEFGERASEEAQARYYREMSAWSAKANITVFFFEAFDEPWKGDPGNASGAEKHWGLWFESRKPKKALGT